MAGLWPLHMPGSLWRNVCMAPKLVNRHWEHCYVKFTGTKQTQKRAIEMLGLQGEVPLLSTKREQWYCKVHCRQAEWVQPPQKRCNEHANRCKKKYKRKILKSTKKNDGIAFHHHQTGHNIDFEGTTILAEEKSYWRRLIVEGIEIKKLNPAGRANIQLGYEIDPRWDPVLYPKKNRNARIWTWELDSRFRCNFKNGNTDKKLNLFSVVLILLNRC